MVLKEFYVKAPDKKHIAVIGAGFFGVLTALKLAQRGFLVTIFEKNTDIILGASYINQNRMHMGYHYPRSDETAKSSNIFQKAYCNMFKESVVNDFSHYYCIAKQGSLVSGKEYLDFCGRMGLPYVKEFPKDITVSPDKVEFCLKVPEKLYDANLLRKSLKNMLDKESNIRLLLSAEVIGINQINNLFEIKTKRRKQIFKERFDAVVNATYSNINRIASMAGFDIKEYQYELCEVPIVKVSWKKRTGCAIMDGPFFGILPFGFSEEYMLYDVGLSVLERCYGKFPEFKKDIKQYDKDDIRSARFKKYMDKAKKYIAEMENCKHLYSVYVTRVVLKGKEKSDERPTEILYHGNGFWSIFSGKVSMAIPTSDKIVEEVEIYFNKLKKQI